MSFTTAEQMNNQVTQALAEATAHEERAKELTYLASNEQELGKIAQARAEFFKKSAAELAKIEEKQGAITGVVVASVKSKSAKSAKSAGRGRPKGSKNKSASEVGAEAGTTRRQNDQSLREICLDILKRNKNGLKLDEIVVKAKEAGYKSSAKNFSNNVYQTLNNLVNKDKAISKDENKRYVLAA